MLDDLHRHENAIHKDHNDTIKTFLCTLRHAACDPMLWQTLDLSMMSSNFIKIPLEPYVYVNARSDKQLTKLLMISLNLSRGSIKTLIFNFNLYVCDAQLTYTAERCPNLKRLVLPAWNRIKKTVLSLRCSTVYLNALLLILDGLKNLEVLNISHCLIVDAQPPSATRKLVEKLDDSVLEKGSRLKEFFTCMDDSCTMCEITRRDEGLIRWYRYEEGLWKQDEVKSLAV
ncbi:hypothetical protein L1987_24781 [Smallanthus sonchifolius]|uniref:Uncharacterized protein n=1 Tax=Smallanthus sonchifolius TaxID=185202 RepID=A0ACB9IN64_9ASTR|nr:hypothetical protein L1987_24781 [Smallanthus sonchifolius]